MSSNDYLFTSESVSEGHPDKVADQISDAILDAILAQDPKARVAAETLCNTGLVVLAGEISIHANVNYIQVARETIKRIGYDNTDYGIDYRGCAVMVCYDKQSPEITHAQIEEAVIEEIIKKVLPAEWLTDTKYLVNPTGRFVIGGPQGDCGLTGRKIIVDTYGGASPHGGGAFS